MNSNSKHYVRKTPLIETMDVTEDIITTVPFFGGPTILPLASLAVRFATTGKPSHKQNLLKTSKTVETYNVQS